MSHNLLSELQLQAAKEVIEQETANFLQHLPHFIEETMREATLTALGLRRTHKGLAFTDASDNWLRTYFRDEITDAVTAHMHRYIGEVLQAVLQDGALRAKIITELRDVYVHTALSAFRELVRTRATRDANDLIGAIGERLKYDPNQDINDPESYCGPIGNILLKQIAKNIVEDEGNHGVIGFDGNDWTIDDEVPF